MKSINLLYTVLIASLIMGCDDTEDYFTKQNNDPFISFTYSPQEDRVILDSVKLSKNGQGYRTTMTVNDTEDRLFDVFYESRSGDGYMVSSGRLTPSTLYPTSELRKGTYTYDIEYRPDDLGFHELEFIAQDVFLETDTITLQLRVFDNLKPVARLNIRPTRVVDRYEYTIDASESFDQDELYGGNIVLYRFNINSKIIELEEPSFRYVFSGENIFELGLRVLDNDGVWSDTYEEIIAID